MSITKRNLEVSAGTIHELPQDLKLALLEKPEVLEKWNKLTPLARNEWICWVTIVKKEETRKAHIVRLSQEVGEGEKRPCCWPGCPHHRPDAGKWFKPRKK
jgi:uncharacterized protein YdeI (YjbR/CyaY-like superfamily)